MTKKLAHEYKTSPLSDRPYKSKIRVFAIAAIFHERSRGATQRVADKKEQGLFNFQTAENNISAGSVNKVERERRSRTRTGCNVKRHYIARVAFRRRRPARHTRTFFLFI